MTVYAFWHHASFSGTAIRRNEAAPRERDAIVSNRVSNGPVMPDGQAKVARNHNPRVGGSSPSSGIAPKAPGDWRSSASEASCDA
jgi:hypothetical protein